MAIFRSSLQVFSRSKGHTATAAAAYRSATLIRDERTGVVHDYRRRRGVEAVEMFAPNDAPDWVRDPSALWNAAEKKERVNGRTAREWLVALPHELCGDQQQELVRDIARDLVGRYSVAVMAATHSPSKEGDHRNHHVHLLFTTRRVGADGLGAKVRVLDDRITGPQEVEHLRRRVAELTNAHLAAAGHAARVDHRLLSVQAKEAEESGDFARAFALTRAVQRTEGKAATAARRRGEQTTAGEWNDSVKKDNLDVLRHYVHRIERAVHHPNRKVSPNRAVAAIPRRPRVRLPSMPSSIIAAIERIAGAFGPGGHTLNQQSRQLREQRREREAATRRFVRMLEEEMARIEKNNRQTIALYAAIARLKRADIRALAAHCARDPSCPPLLRRSVGLRQRIGELEETADARRRAHGLAMVQTAQARSAVNEVEETKPARWHPLRRREWAEVRRRQRAKLISALKAEHAARAAVEAGGSNEGRGEQRRLRAELDRLEQERRSKFPLQGNAVEPIDKTAKEARRKIGNKIENEQAGQPKGTPRPTLTPRMVRRHRYRI